MLTKKFTLTLRFIVEKSFTFRKKCTVGKMNIIEFKKFYAVIVNSDCIVRYSHALEYRRGFSRQASVKLLPHQDANLSSKRPSTIIVASSIKFAVILVELIVATGLFPARLCQSTAGCEVHNLSTLPVCCKNRC